MKDSCPVCGGEFDDCQFKTDSPSHVQCQTCRLIRRTPIPSPSERITLYTALAEHGNYAVYRHFDQERRRMCQSLWNQIRARAGMTPERVLEIGCATGVFMDVIRESGSSVEGIELLPALAQTARAKGHAVRDGDVLSLEISPQSYDLVIATDVIEHLTHPVAFVRKCRAALRPGGWLFLTTPNTRSLPAQILRSRWTMLRQKDHLFLFDSANLRRLLETEGFSEVDIARLWKRLPLRYVIRQLEIFLPEWRRGCRFLENRLPAALLDSICSVYGGEVQAFARR